MKHWKKLPLRVDAVAEQLILFIYNQGYRVFFFRLLFALSRCGRFSQKPTFNLVNSVDLEIVLEDYSIPKMLIFVISGSKLNLN